MVVNIFHFETILKRNSYMKIKALLSSVLLLSGTAQVAHATLLSDPNDSRSWQGATVGTFAALYYGSNTLATRTAVVTNSLLDDGVFNPTGYTAGTMMSTPWLTGGGGGCLGISSDLTGTGSYDYSCSGSSAATHGNAIDNLWFQTSGAVGETVFDLGFSASKAAVFNSIDHGPLPGEAIESTVYLSNDLSTWTVAVVERVWLEGFMSNTGILWDGFTYAVGTGTSATFRYASIIHGGSGALVHDGDNEINGIMGLKSDYTPVSVPEPASLVILAMGLLGLGFSGRNRKK
ncbi:MAG: PEP-CTERM sorting domain-containing protein [Gammaproteobacteria bacterium]|nr:MAG: PEP-CTERM sorting domain-containing protein [Gammaproteobacteria bacterium]